MSKTQVLYQLPTKPIKGTFYRYIRTKYADEPLSMLGSQRNGGRYNVAGLFGALYLGFDRKTCEAEVSQGIAAGIDVLKKGAFTAWSYAIELHAVVRLDGKSIQKQIGITQADLTIKGDHRTASGIGEHLHKRGDTEGLVAPSAQLKDGKCLDIFLDRKKETSKVLPKRKLRTWP